MDNPLRYPIQGAILAAARIAPVSRPTVVDGVSERFVFFLPPLQLQFAAALRVFDPCHQGVAVEGLRSVNFVFRMQCLQPGLDRATVVRPVVVLPMQYQPEFEARVGTPDADTMHPAQLHRFIEPRMLVPIEYRPYLIPVLERIFPAATSRTESEFAGRARLLSPRWCRGLPRRDEVPTR